MQRILILPVTCCQPPDAKKVGIFDVFGHSCGQNGMYVDAHVIKIPESVVSTTRIYINQYIGRAGFEKPPDFQTLNSRRPITLAHNNQLAKEKVTLPQNGLFAEEDMPPLPEQIVARVNHKRWFLKNTPRSP